MSPEPYGEWPVASGEAGVVSGSGHDNSPLTTHDSLITPVEREELQLTALVRHRLEEHFENLDQQHTAASLGMWVFLATEVMFFGTLFTGLGIYRGLYPEAFDAASSRLNWLIGGINTVVLLVSSLTMVLAVHHARHGERKLLMVFLAATAFLGVCFLCLKGLEYYLDYVDNLIPGWKFDEREWIEAGLTRDQVPRVELFLLFYWIMTGFHGLHVIIGILVVATMFVLAKRGLFSAAYYSPVDVTGLYWHFVDIVWIFLLPMLYLLGGHR
jgi:cytochrome c oxidase subunit 3